MLFPWGYYIYSFSLDIELEAMNKSALEQAIIDILENDIWDVDHNHGKIKRTAIERLSKLVEHIYEEKQDPASAYELSCYGCGSSAGICDCNNR